MNNKYEYYMKRSKQWSPFVILGLIIAVISAFVCLLFGVLTLDALIHKDNQSRMIFIVLTIVALALTIGAILLFVIANKKESYYNSLARLERGDARNMEELKQLEQREMQAILSQRQAMQQQRQQEIYNAQHPQCPACHGFRTQRISTTKRALHVGVAGFASSTIGKQYECLECRHKW